MEKKPQDYKDLVVWQKGISLAKAIYGLTTKFPGEERFGARRANATRGDLNPFQYRRRAGASHDRRVYSVISHAEGSTAELETQVILSIELGFAEAENMKAALTLLDDIRRMLNGLRRKLSGDK